MTDFNAAQRVLRHKDVMKPELVAEAVSVVERVVLAGILAFAMALPRNPLRPGLDLTRAGEA